MDKEIEQQNGLVPVQQESVSNLIKDEELLKDFAKIEKNIDDNNIELDHYISTFYDLVINEDSSSACKEALVNLIKLKNENSDRLTKVVELKTRIKVKDNGFPRFLANNSNNKTININDAKVINKKDILKELRDEGQ